MTEICDTCDVPMNWCTCNFEDDDLVKALERRGYIVTIKKENVKIPDAEDRWT